MALVNLESALRKTINALKKAKEGTGFEILSYKRNRGISVIKEPGQRFWLRERGYLDQEFECSDKELQKHLKSMMKREFPRSRKVRMYFLESKKHVGTQRKKL